MKQEETGWASDTLTVNALANLSSTTSKYKAEELPTWQNKTLIEKMVFEHLQNMRRTGHL